MNGQMLWHINQLHHRDVRYVELDFSIANGQALGDDNALRAKVLVHHMVMVQVGQLAKNLYCNLRHFLLGKGLLQVAQMVQIVLSLIQKLVYDVYVVLRLENIQIRLNPLIVKALQLPDLLCQTPDLALLDPE